MTQVIQIRCNVCNNILDENDLVRSKGLLGMGAEKPTSNNNINITYQKLNRKGDLCFGCAKKINDFIETLKVKK